jgi:dipeptidyl aminopeptidase/acylaminoacyl peptidase
MDTMLLLRTVILILAVLMSAGQSFAQGTRADYDRSKSVDRQMRDKVFRDRVQPKWFGDDSRFWYRVPIAPNEHEFILVDAAAKLRRVAFNHQVVADYLSESLGRDISPNRLPIDRLRFTETHIVIQAGGKQWQLSHDGKEWSPWKRQEEIAGFSLDPLRAPQKSGSSSQETSIRFVNHWTEPVEIFWIDRDGRRKKYTTLAVDQSHDQHTYSGHVWLITADRKTLLMFSAVDQPSTAVINAKTVAAGPPRSAQRRGRDRSPGRGVSPDRKWKAAIVDHNVQLTSTESGKTFMLSEEASSADRFQGRFYWSPDSQNLVVMQVQQGEEHLVHLIESSPKDQVQPKLHAFNYLKPGDKLPVPRPRLFQLESKRQIELDDTLFSDAWSIDQVQWKDDSSRFTFLFNPRGHQTLRILAVDRTSGDVTAIVDEKCETFFDYAYKKFTHYVEESDELIWMSERDGWNHLYLIDLNDGHVKHQITSGEWVVRGVEKVDVAARQIWFRAGGYYPDQDPYYVHLGRVDFDGKNLEILTEGNGTHSWQFSPDRRWFVDTWSRVDLPPVNELRHSATGERVCLLEEADWSRLLDIGWTTPERFVAKARDGKTDIYGIIIRPLNFDPAKSYPVIEEIYAGPHGSFVPKAFGRHIRQQRFAELGFIIVRIDGMGTSNRSKAFHDVAWKNIGDAGFPDRVLWMKAAAERHSEMDLSQVGIYGGSAGGQNALRAVLAHGDFYHVAVADCGCHDNRMDKVWWNELWMSWPIGDHYREQSNVTNAYHLKGKLMLIVGELDRNVDPASTMQVVDALIKADKDFDLLILPGVGHGAAETAYGSRRRFDFFVRHLHHAEPRR